MDTVELRGLKYDAALQDGDSGYSLVLSSVLKSKVSSVCPLSEKSMCPSHCVNCSFHFLSD